MISLIIKGSRGEAAAAVANRGIPFVFRNEVGNRTVGIQTVGFTGDQHRDKLARWFAEQDGAPFPTRTLLLFTGGFCDECGLSPCGCWDGTTRGARA
jgi:hypothetical protein